MVYAWSYINYVVKLSRGEDGNLGGECASRQLREFEYPGLMGFHPMLEIDGDRLRLSAHPRERAIPGCTGVLMWPFFSTAWFKYRMKRASYRTIESSLIGIGEHVAPGRTLLLVRDKHLCRAAGDPRQMDISVLDGQHILFERRASYVISTR